MLPANRVLNAGNAIAKGSNAARIMPCRTCVPGRSIRPLQCFLDPPNEPSLNGTRVQLLGHFAQPHVIAYRQAENHKVVEALGARVPQKQWRKEVCGRL